LAILAQIFVSQTPDFGSKANFAESSGSAIVVLGHPGRELLG